MNRTLCVLVAPAFFGLASAALAQPLAPPPDPRLATLPQLLSGSPTELFLTGWPVGDDVFRDVARECPNMDNLQISGTQITDVGVRDLAPLSKLQCLNLDSTEITDDSLGEIGHFFPGLTTLDVSRTRITAAGVRRLEVLGNLHYLHLSNVPIDDECCASIAKLRHLRVLSLAESRVTDDGVAKLVAALPDLEGLWLNGTPTSDESVVLIAKHLGGMRELGLGRNATDAGVAALQRLKLSTLDATSANLTDAGVRMAARLPLRTFRAKGPAISLAGLAVFADAPLLDRLEVDGASYEPGSTDFAWLRTIRRLHFLSLTNCALGDAEAQQIARALRGRGLNMLGLNGTQVTDQGRAALAQAHAVGAKPTPFWRFW